MCSEDIRVIIEMNSNPIRFFDVIVSGLLIIMFLPLMFLVSILVTVFIGFPPLYFSRRIGKNGVLFNHCKFRSMLPGKETGRIFFEQDRLNRVGKIIRKLHWDELPELFLVLSGKMSFVGPRPLLPKLLEGLVTTKREKVLPGLTGLAQIALYKKGSLDKRLQIRLDNFYVHKRCLRYNLEIMHATIRYLLKAKKLDLSPDLTKDRRSFAGTS
jgi:lipopolysaccharide/colanic/teichoic acid biosynthesis glycosyltransferase